MNRRAFLRGLLTTTAVTALPVAALLPEVPQYAVMATRVDIALPTKAEQLASLENAIFQIIYNATDWCNYHPDSRA